MANRAKERLANQYPEKVHNAFESRRVELGLEPDFLALDANVPDPKHGDWWGSWRYNAKANVLEYYNEEGFYRYEVDLDRASTATGFLNWEAHLCEKTWAKGQTMGDFIEAIDDLFGIYRMIDAQQNI